IYLSPIKEQIPELIPVSRNLVIKTDRCHSQGREAMQFIWLRYAVMVLINPQQQTEEYRIPLVNDSITIAAILRFVEFRQRQEAIGGIRCCLCSVVAKQLCAVVNHTVAVAV